MRTSLVIFLPDHVMYVCMYVYVCVSLKSALSILFSSSSSSSSSHQHHHHYQCWFYYYCCCCCCCCCCCRCCCSTNNIHTWIYTHIATYNLLGHHSKKGPTYLPTLPTYLPTYLPCHHKQADWYYIQVAV